MEESMRQKKREERRRKRVFKLLVLATALTIVFFAYALCTVSKSADKDSKRMAETFQAERQTPDDVILLAKFMQIRSSDTFPDFVVMLLGETVMNRVESWRFPNNVADVINADNPVWIPERYTSLWETEPSERYIELAKRVINGERAIGNGEIVFCGTSPEGTGTIVSYFDETSKQITYFCKG